jgi:hypothetical protein
MTSPPLGNQRDHNFVLTYSYSQRQPHCFLKDNAVKYKTRPTVFFRGQDNSVGIATGYGLDGAGIESQWGQGFSHTSRLAMRPTQPPVQLVPGLSRG